MPSRWETFGLVFLEAMNYSLPILSTRTQAIPEVVEHSVTGLLSTNEDVPALARNMETLMTNSELRGQLGAHGNQRLPRGFPTTHSSIHIWRFIANAARRRTKRVTTDENLFFSALYAPRMHGGAEKIVQILAEEMQAAGHTAIVVTTSPEHGTTVGHVNGVKVYYIGIRNLYWPYDGEKRAAFARLLWHMLDRNNWFDDARGQPRDGSGAPDHRQFPQSYRAVHRSLAAGKPAARPCRPYAA